MKIKIINDKIILDIVKNLVQCVDEEMYDFELLLPIFIKTLDKEFSKFLELSKL